MRLDKRERRITGTGRNEKNALMGMQERSGFVRGFAYSVLGFTVVLSCPFACFGKTIAPQRCYTRGYDDGLRRGNWDRRGAGLYWDRLYRSYRR